MKISILALAAASVVALAACNKGAGNNTTANAVAPAVAPAGNAVSNTAATMPNGVPDMATVRQAIVAQCAQGQGAMASLASHGVDLNRMCNCVGDKVTQGHSVADLAHMGDADGRRAAAECLAEQGVNVPPGLLNGGAAGGADAGAGAGAGAGADTGAAAGGAAPADASK